MRLEENSQFEGVLGVENNLRLKALKALLTANNVNFSTHYAVFPRVYAQQRLGIWKGDQDILLSDFINIKNWYIVLRTDTQPGVSMLKFRLFDHILRAMVKMEVTHPSHTVREIKDGLALHQNIKRSERTLQRELAQMSRERLVYRRPSNQGYLYQLTAHGKATANDIEE